MFYSAGVFLLWRMEWMSHLISCNFTNSASNLNQGNTWKYCTRLPIPITVSLSYKAITGNQNISEDRCGPKKHFWRVFLFYSFSWKSRNPSWKVPLWMFSSSLHLTFLCIQMLKVHPLLPLNGVMDCLVYYSEEILHIFVLSQWRSFVLVCARLPCLLDCVHVTTTHRGKQMQHYLLKRK